jgi:ubiquinone/menaquinone biosynthesis C-methylase UbiE
MSLDELVRADRGASAIPALESPPAPPPPPDAILQLGMAFWGSKTLLSAVELGLFSLLAEGPKTGRQIEAGLNLAPRATFDFLDALLALGMLERDGAGEAARYRNTPATSLYLDRASPHYVGGILEMANARLYRFWGDLTEALRTGKPQNEVKHSGRPMFDELYADPARLEQFMAAMAGISRANFTAFAEKFDFSRYATLADIGGATGQLACLVTERHPHITARSCDLPAVRPIAERHISARGMNARVTAEELDFLAQDFPQADVITMGMILHDWDLPHKKMLIAKAYRALPKGGALVAIENIIDDSRRRNAFGLLMSLNMLIEFGDAFDFTGADFESWCFEAGFRRVEVIPLAGPASAAVAHK